MNNLEQLTQVIIPLSIIVSCAVMIVGLISGLTANTRTFKRFVKRIKF